MSKISDQKIVKGPAIKNTIKAPSGFIPARIRLKKVNGL